MSVEEHLTFNIPTGPDDTEGFTVRAMTMPNQDDTLHGFVGLSSTINAESIPVLINALHACLQSLEDNCHNHPTQPIKEVKS
jgi:hypothetical protein